jgi:hypothetical protein
VSPILVRPVREQLEHDRLVRLLQAKYKRKFEVAVNLGDEQTTPVKIGPVVLFPDLVLSSDKKLAGVVEVESAESVNNLEARWQWVPFSKARAPFHLYVPVQAYESARRLCDANHAIVSEIWTYRPTTDSFDLVRMFADSSKAAAAAAAAARRADRAAKGRSAKKPAAKAPTRPSANRARKPSPARSAKPARGVRAAAKPARKRAR